MPAPAKLIDLIDRFERNLDAYRAGQYNETQVRREFIDPFLKLLGWDVDNEKGYAEAYKEVVHEDAIRVGRSTKAPDYSLRIGGQRKLFVEAKKPSVNLKEEIAPAFQVRRYAWSAKLPLSILTDFEEFAVYDCRPKPNKNDPASHSRIMYLTFREYAVRWDELAALFSPEAIRRGSFDRYVQSSKAKRGTAAVDDAFLAEINEWRHELARNIALRNPGISTRQLNFAVQRTIDRLIFLRIAEDRGIERYGRLRERAAGKDIYHQLGDLFRLADQKYNSGLFHFRPEKGRDDESLDEFTLGLTIDDKTLKSIVKRLYYPDSPYQFDVIPADILGQVYEQFLGQVIRLTAGGQAKVEAKPEVKKAGGVFYTPTYIVDYIVQETVGQLVAGKKPGPAGGVSKLRILDPACGSGSFLIGAYQFLLDWHLDAYLTEADKWARRKEPPLYQNDRGEWQLTITERKRILLNNIYGVDIDPQAVEVTKLSLLLKVMEGETEASLGTQMRLLPERVLPDLSANIKCGNSLIGPDFYDGQLSLGILDEAEMYRINVFDWAAAFPTIVPWGGFDAVIGNPPYIRSINVKESYPKEWEFYRSHYTTASSREWDIYLIFVEKALGLLKADGRLGYILPNKFLNSQVGENLRGILAADRVLERLVHFEAFQVFRGATTYTCLLFLNKARQNKAIVAKYRGPISKIERCPMPEEASGLWITSTVDADELSTDVWEFPSKTLRKLKRWPGMGTVTQIFQGTGTRADKVYMLEKRGVENDLVRVHSPQLEEELLLEPEFLRPGLRGRSIKRYEIEDNLLLLVPYEVNENGGKLVPLNVLAADAPRTFEYLQRCRSRLDAREKGRFKGREFYQYGRPQNLHRFEVPEKIVFPDVVIRGECHLDSEGYWLLDTAYAIILNEDVTLDLRYVLGILNSPILTYYLQETGTPLRGGYFRMKTAYLREFPLRPIDFANSEEKSQHDLMVALVTQMIDLHKRLAAAQTSHEKTILQRQITATDRQIDQLVYQLYNLTPAEIAIVEAQT